MTIDERVELYKRLYKNSVAIEPVKEMILSGIDSLTGLEALEKIRELNTSLADLYQISIPVITVWVRDDNYVQATEEIYLTDPKLEPFLHQFRHHLQNIERKYERRGLTSESVDREYWSLPYKDTLFRMYGEDDARAWARFLIEY